MAMNHPEFARLIAARLAEASLTIDRQCNRIRSRIWEFDDEFGGAPDIAPNWTGDILNDQELTGLAVSLIDAKLLLDEVVDAVERSRDEHREVRERREAAEQAAVIAARREAPKSLWRRIVRRVRGGSR